MKTIRWGILGCGKIARKFAADLRLVEGAELIAAGARTMDSVMAFTNEFPVKHAHDSYEALTANPEVDVIYIASPHAFHYEHAMLCLRHGKAVLCEKPFTINAPQSRKVFEYAKKQELFIMEALWTRFLPHYIKTRQHLESGAIGSIKFLRAEFGFKPNPPIPQRLSDPALGGGALLDVGIYPVFLALDLLGTPDEIDAKMIPMDTGVDAQCSIRFMYKNGSVAHLLGSLAAKLGTEAEISGEAGRLLLTSRFHEPTGTILYFKNADANPTEILVEKTQGNGYEFEATHVTQCLRQSLKESPIFPPNQTMRLMETLDIIRRSCGLVYPKDVESY